MSRPFHWGIIGPGKIAHQFASDISKINNCQLHAVASRSIERAQAFAQQYGAPHAFGNYQDIINCPELDAVYIATPHSSHFENTLLCLEARIPVLCEKPFALNSSQARQMVDIAQVNNVFLMEALWTRFLPSMLKTMDLVNSGAIGEIVSLKADFGFKAPFDPESRIFNPDLGGGSLLDIGIYPVFLALLLLGKPQQIKAFANFGPTGVDMDCGMLLQYEDQKLAHLHSTLLARTKTEAFIYGTEGTIHMHTRWHEPTSISIISLDGRPENFHFDWSDNGYGFEAKEVMKCIGMGLKESPARTLDDTLLLMETLDAIRAEIGLRYPGEV
jgi:predicted dehydrogenase